MREIYVRCIETGDHGTAQGVAQWLIDTRRKGVGSRQALANRIITASKPFRGKRRGKRKAVLGLTFERMCGACSRGCCYLHGKGT